MPGDYTLNDRVKWLHGLHKIPASATVAIEDSKGRLLVVMATYKSYWTMPGGVIDPGESPRSAALREVKEEVGLAFGAEEVEFIGTVFRSSDILDTYQFIFGTTVGDGAAATITLQANEIAEYAFVSKEQILEADGIYAPVVVSWAREGIAHYSEESIDLLAE